MRTKWLQTIAPTKWLQAIMQTKWLMQTRWLQTIMQTKWLQTMLAEATKKQSFIWLSPAKLGGKKNSALVSAEIGHEMWMLLKNQRN